MVPWEALRWEALPWEALPWEVLWEALVDPGPWGLQAWALSPWAWALRALRALRAWELLAWGRGPSHGKQRHPQHKHHNCFVSESGWGCPDRPCNRRQSDQLKPADHRYCDGCALWQMQWQKGSMPPGLGSLISQLMEPPMLSNFRPRPPLLHLV